MKLFLILFVGLILEILVWIGVGDLVGSMWYVFFWFVAAFFIGLNMIRKYSAGVMPQMQQMQMGGDPALTNNLPKIIAGFLLMIPGLITDVLALLILIPGIQNLFKNMAMNMMMKRQQDMMNKMMGGMMGDMNGMGGAQGQNPFEDMMRQMQDMQNQQNGRGDSTIIDGEAREITPEAKQIEMKDINPK
ncbi:FxsA family protein [Acinetobacter equi]|uniref:FxsA protein n=1 Tax=Acinetobacter equi TaxID=1324350 RepID=A0A0N7GXY4_9GAMM|nr:FxsA family protein [Acinetobacter equi]ALH96003.1 FxsA protein [Acinetobacter equi]